MKTVFTLGIMPRSMDGRLTSVTQKVGKVAVVTFPREIECAATLLPSEDAGKGTTATMFIQEEILSNQGQLVLKDASSAEKLDIESRTVRKQQIGAP